MSNKIDLKSPAKINLYLYITGKLENGYHTLDTLMVPVSIYDEISLELKKEPGIFFHFETSNNIPKNEKNIAWKAARLFFDKLGTDNGLEIKIKKNIPVEAGLGGGSTDAASVLKGLNFLFKKPFTDEYLETISAGLGADVPFFFFF